MRIANGQVYTDNGFIYGGVEVQNGRITQVLQGPVAAADFDAAGGYILPGFIDLHCHGGGWAEFMQGTAQAFQTAGRLHLAHGTTTLYPTTGACPATALQGVFEAYRQTRSAPDMPRMPGVHLEGSYFAPEQAGAQNPAYIVLPNPDEYRRMTRLYPEIARWDYAPELPGADAFLQHLQACGIVPSYAHTAATAKQILQATAAGCRLATHLYSGMTLTHRHNAWRVAGAVEGCYLAENSYAELIADGCHLPFELLRLAHKILGPKRIALVTDALAAAGATDGQTPQTGASLSQEIIIEDGVAKMPDRQAFAGSIATTDRLLATGLKAGLPMHDVVTMLTATPAAIMGLQDRGRLAPGLLGDLVVTTPQAQLVAVFLGGRRVEL